VPIDDWARAADLAALAVVVLACALCARRISRDETLELPLPAAAAAVRSRRRVLVAGLGAVADLAFVGAAFADLQSHPLDVFPSTSCGAIRASCSR
jgi:hypothetical protein